MTAKVTCKNGDTLTFSDVANVVEDEFNRQLKIYDTGGTLLTTLDLNEFSTYISEP